MKKSILFGAIVTLIFCMDAEARLSRVKTFQDWGVYQDTKKGKLLCYAISNPFRTKAFYGVRNLPFATIAYKGPERFSLSINSGFPLDKNKGLILTVNNKAYTLNIASISYAWTYDSTQDVSIIDGMIKDNRFFKVRSYSTNDEVALDYYSIKGMEEALHYMSINCPG